MRCCVHYLDIRYLFVDTHIVISHLHVFGVRVEANFMHTFHGQSSVYYACRWVQGAIRRWIRGQRGIEEGVLKKV